MPVFQVSNQRPVDNKYRPITTGGSATGAYAGGVPADIQAEMTRRIFNTTLDQNVGVSVPEHVARWVMGTTVDFFDTAYGSRFIPGTERGDIWSLLDGTEQKDYYERNKSVIEGSSALVGLIGTAVVGGTVVLPRLGAALAESTFLTSTRAWQAGARWNAETRAAMLAAQRNAAAEGLSGGLLMSRAGQKFLALEVLKGAGIGAAEEALMYGVMNANEAAYSNNLSTELLWAGLGVGIGGAIWGVGARATARQFANSKEIRDIRAAALDPSGTSAQLVSSDPIARVAYGEFGDLRIKESAKTTEFLIASRAATPQNAADNVKSAMHDIRAKYADAAFQSTQKMFSAGIDGVQTERGSIGKSVEVKQMLEAAKDDPFLFHGLDQIGIPKEGLKESFKAREDHIKFLRELADTLETQKGEVKQARKKRELARHLEEQESFVFMNGRWSNAADKEVELALKFNPDRVQYVKGTNPKALGVNLNHGRVWVDEGFSLSGIRRKFQDLELNDRLKIVEATRRVQAKMKLAKETHIVSKKNIKDGNWYAMDSALEYAAIGGKVDLSASGLRDIHELKIESLKAKAIQFFEKFGETGSVSEWDRLGFNLPGGTSFERMEDGAGDLLREWLRGVLAVDTKKTSALVAWGELEEALVNSRAVVGYDLLKAASGESRRIDGNLFNWNRTGTGKWLRPVLGYFDSASKLQPISKEGIAEALAQSKLTVVQELLSVPDGNFAKVATQILLEMPETQKAMNVLGLADDQVTGLGNSVSQAAGEILTSRMRWRDNETILAASRVQEMIARGINAQVEKLMKESGLSDDLTRVNSMGKESKKVLLNQFFSVRGGWDLEQTPVQLGKGKWGFALRDSENNRMRLGVEEVEPDDLLMNPRTNQPIVLDDDTLSIVERFTKVADEVRQIDNAIRAAHGRPPIEKMSWYAPSPSTVGKRVAFVYDEFNTLVKGRTIVAHTDEAFESLKKRTFEDLASEYGEGHGYTIRDKASLDSYTDHWDLSEMDWIEPNMTSRPAGSQTGGLTGAFISPTAFEDALDWVRRKTTNQGNDIIRTLFDEQIQVARMHGSVERAAKGESTAVNKSRRTIWDEYEAALLGKQMSYSESSILGGTLAAIEKRIDKVLASTQAKIAPRWIFDVAGKMGVPTSRLNKVKEYKDIAKELGDYTPYKNAVDYAESQLNFKRPPEVRQIAQKTNQLAAALMLRYLELPHAMLNMMGVVATMPALIRSGKAPITAGFTLKDGSRLNAVDSARIFAQSMKDMWAPRSMADWRHMERMGDASQEVADFNRAMASIQSQAGWRRVMFGTGKKSDPFYTRMGIDKMLGIATDKTENWSRQWAHFAGLRLADYHGIKGMGARHDFAREIANSVIADYAPVNRPELFQTGLGSMFGLFMTYMMNQNMKLFRWLENKQFAEAGTHLAMQGALFGALGVPGVKQMLAARDWWEGTGKDEPTAVDRLYAQFGPVLGAALANGSVSLTGVAFHTRGDMSIRVSAPSANLLTSAPGIKIVSGVASAIVETVQMSLSSYSPSVASQVMETVVREMPNRVAKGMLAVLVAGGTETDHYGNIVSETRTWMDTAARMVGLRSTRQQAEIEQFYASKSAADKDAARMERLRKSLRSELRAADSHSEVDFMGYFEKYVKAGGNPKTFRTWIQNALRDSGSSRAVNALRRNMANPQTQLEAWRFGAYGANRGLVD